MGVSRLSGGAQMRKEINKQLVGWIRERARTSFGGDISLVAIYGSHINGTDQEWSDVDCYFIPKTDRGRAFGLDFILAGVRFDIFPLSWERLQGIAHLQEPLVPLVGDAVLLYSDSQEDTDRFQALQRELAACLADKAYCGFIGPRPKDRWETAGIFPPSASVPASFCWTERRHWRSTMGRIFTQG